jgi:hypothetical protein
MGEKMKNTAHSITARNPVKFQAITANTILLTALVLMLMLTKPHFLNLKVHLFG